MLATRSCIPTRLRSAAPAGGDLGASFESPSNARRAQLVAAASELGLDAHAAYALSGLANGVALMSEADCALSEEEWTKFVTQALSFK